MLAPGAQAVVPAGSISGAVTATVGGAPIQGIEVCAYNEDDWDQNPTCEDTDAGGLYTLSALPPGEYLVEFWSNGLNYRSEFYNDKTSWEDADLVTVTNGAKTGIDAALASAGSIAGKVLAAVGAAPLEHVEVCAFTLAGAFGGCGYTDGTGKYAIGGLAAGSYKVEFWPGSSNRDYLPQYFANKLSWSTATPVAVVVGVTTPNIDAELQLGGRISGTVTDAVSHAPLGDILVCVFDASFESQGCELTDAVGHYTIWPLFTGSYKVGFTSDYEEEEGDYVTQYYAGKAKFSEAGFVPVVAPQTVSGVDAQMVNKHPAIVAPPSAPPASPQPLPATPALKCKKGFQKKKVKGVSRCVRKHRKHRRHHAPKHGAGRLASIR